MIPIYRQEGDLYRNKPTSKVYRQLPGALSAAGLPQPKRRAVTIRVYDRNDILKEIISSNTGEGFIIDVSFDLQDSGCGAFEVELTKKIDVGHDWRFDIHLWNDPLPWYSGFLQRFPRAGSTVRSYKYSGHGGVSMFSRVQLSKKYPGQRVDKIVKDVFQTAEAALGSRIIYDASQIDVSKYSTTADVRFINTPMKDAMKQLSNLSGGFEYGVDERRRMFFRKPSTKVNVHAWVGKHVETYVPEEDSSGIVNVMKIKAGKVRTDIPTDNLYYKTNFLLDELENTKSIQDYGRRVGTYSAPSVISLIDATRAAAVDLKRKMVPVVSAKVRNILLDGQKIQPFGYFRVVGKGGVQLVLPMKKVKYTIRGPREMVEADLGELVNELASWVSDLKAREALEDLARQQSQNQL